jgi:hypothetical protein
MSLRLVRILWINELSNGMWTRDVERGTYRSLYRVVSITTVSKELSRYRLHSVGVQEIIWDGSGTEPAGEYTLFYGKENENHELDTEFFLHKSTISAVRWVEFASGRMS